MDIIKLLVRYIIIVAGFAVISSCSYLIKPQPLVPFEEAISTLAGNLLGQVKADRPLPVEKGAINVMLIPFVDANSGEVPEVSWSIEKIVIDVGRRNFEGINLARLTLKNIDRADYIIDGFILLEFSKSKDTAKQQKHYHVFGTVGNLADKKIIGESNVWISDTDLNYTPTSIYRDSPLYFKSRRLTKADKTRRQTYKKDFFGVSLKTRAMLIEGRTAYENGNYEAAEALFSMAANRKDGQDLGTYAGLYLANHKLGRFEEAEKAFAEVVSISVEKYRFLTVKYLFGVDSVEFLQDENLKARYDTWIRNIGKYFHNSNHCLRIIGHASHTGTKAYNDQLSLERAKSIQKQLRKTFPEVFQRSQVIGKGFSENIVGTGSDDERDALDRRVELFIIDCNPN